MREDRDRLGHECNFPEGQQDGALPEGSDGNQKSKRQTKHDRAQSQWSCVGKSQKINCPETSPMVGTGSSHFDAFAGTPLFDFLLGYASATKHPEVVSELYWALVCLCHQPNGGEAFKAARAALLKALQAGDDHFLQDCRRA
eukprot:s746_g4.t1